MSAFLPGDWVRFKDPGDVTHRTLEWKIVRIWDTNCEGLRAYLSRPDKTKRRGVDRCAAQLDELERAL